MNEAVSEDEVVDHIVNSLDNTDASEYTDDYGYSWSVSRVENSVAVEVTHPSGDVQKFYLTPEEA